MGKGEPGLVARLRNAFYTFAAPPGGFLPTPQINESCVHDPLSAGRRLASRTIAWQSVAAVLVAAAFIVESTPAALAAAMGGLAVVAGSAVSALIALGGGVQPAGMAMGRLLAGLMLKWFVVLAILGFGLAGLRLTPLPMLVGVLAATLALVLANISRK